MPLAPNLYLDLIGKPFLHRGRGPKFYDCAGLVLEILRRMGTPVPDLVYGADLGGQGDALREGFVLMQKTGWQKAEVDAGAVLLFQRANAPAHVGLALSGSKFIHSSFELGQAVISRLDGPAATHSEYLLGAYRYAD